MYFSIVFLMLFKSLFFKVYDFIVKTIYSIL